MIRWLEDNPVGLVLASISAGLVVISLLLAVIWSLPPATPGEGAGDEGSDLSLEVPQLAVSEPIDGYAVITERPVFNEGRLPELETDQGEGDLDELAEEEVDAPDVELAGVIITPSIRMVTLRQKSEKESLVAFEGQPLEGDYGSWHVSRIEPREITLSSGSGEEVQLQLQIHDVQIETPPKMTQAEKTASPGESGDSTPDDDRPMSRAEEIRQRIAERREELRQAAEAEQESQPKPADYKSAIQSLMGGKQNQAKDENEQ